MNIIAQLRRVGKYRKLFVKRSRGGILADKFLQIDKRVRHGPKFFLTARRRAITQSNKTVLGGAQVPRLFSRHNVAIIRRQIRYRIVLTPSGLVLDTVFYS